MITAMIIVTVFAFGALVCYASCAAAARADEMSEKYLEEHKNELHGQNKNSD